MTCASIVGLLVAEVVLGSTWGQSRHRLGLTEDTAWGFIIATWIYAHLFAVVFRSHANREVFAQFRFRFVSVPLVLLSAFLLSDWMLVLGLVTGALWDVYHSSMQNFGFCRIYDSRAGNPATLGRGLDMMANHVLYIGPILVGLSLKATLAVLGEFSTVGWSVPHELGMRVADAQSLIAPFVLIGGAAFMGYYIVHYWRMAKAGTYRPSTQKIAILCTTGFTSILAWGFMPPFKAFFVANFFHALQYFAIVWALEKKTIAGVFRVEGKRGGRTVAAVLFLTVVLGVGAARAIFGARSGIRGALCLGVVCSLMHFWYDGFVWSVRKKQVDVRA